jgi:hypothetical protein
MWTSEAESMLERWGESAQYYKVLYSLAAEASRRRDRFFGIPLVVLGCITSSSIFIQLDECNINQRIITGSLALLLTTLTAINKTLGYSENQHIFAEVSRSYDDISFDIQEQLSRPSDDRLPCSDFVSTTKIAIRKLRHAPSLPTSVFQRYINDIDHHLQNMGLYVHNTKDTGEKQPIEVKTHAVFDDVESGIISSELFNRQTIFHSA